VLFDHPDLKRAHLGGRLLPGYDFIANAAAANDGDGRDADASDAGDWVTQQESNQGRFAGCDVTNSSWHGTRVAGIIGARTNNSEGVAGGTWSPWILPVRVLGKCGGFDSDILDAMAWAGGLHVAGVPDNPYPAKIENMSLGSSGPCGAAYASVIGELAARGVVVVVSAGGGSTRRRRRCGRSARSRESRARARGRGRAFASRPRVTSVRSGSRAAPRAPRSRARSFAAFRRVDPSRPSEPGRSSRRSRKVVVSRRGRPPLQHGTVRKTMRRHLAAAM
jgi:hypothetical protein